MAELHHKLSKSASNELWNIWNKWFPRLNGHNLKKIPQFRTLRSRIYDDNVPKITLEVAYESKTTGEIIILTDLDATPVSKFPADEYTKLYESATVQVLPIQ